MVLSPGVYNENLLLWKPLKLQGLGPGGIVGAHELQARDPEDPRFSVKGSVVDGRYFPQNAAAFDATVAAHGGYAGVDAAHPVLRGADITVVAQSTSAYNVPAGAAGVFSAARIDGAALMTGQGEGAGGVQLQAHANNSQLTNNVLENNAGIFAGGIGIGQPYHHGSHNYNVRVANDRLTGNGGLNRSGGLGIFYGSNNYDVASNIVCSNFGVEYGAGVSHWGLSPGGRIHDNQVYYNDAVDSGAGISIQSEQPVGGGLGDGSGTVDVDRNLIQSNYSGDDGGGIFVLDALDQAISIRNNQIVDNGAADIGGAITLDDSSNVRIINNTVANNVSTGSSENSDGNPHSAGLASEANSPQFQATLPAGSPDFSNPRALFNNIFWNNNAFTLSQPGPGATLVDGGFIDFEIRGTTNNADTFTPRYSTLTNNQILGPDGVQRPLPGGQGNRVGEDPLFVTPFVLELTVSGSRLDPQVAAVTITGQDPPVGLTGELPPADHVARGRPWGALLRHAVPDTAQRARPVHSTTGPGRRGTRRTPQPDQRDGWRRLRQPVPAAAADPPGAHAVGSRRRRAARRERAAAPSTAMSRHQRSTSASEEDGMEHRQRSGFSRRDFLKAAGLGALGTAVGGGVVGALGWGPPASAATTTLALAATDGYVTMPGREDDPIYIFGFIPVDPGASISDLISTYKGHAQTSAPTLDFLQNDDIKITLTNLGLVQRPDLTDAHTIHWHGFDMPSPLNDGVPEVSVAVPDRQAAHLLLPPAPRGHLHVPLPLRGRRARPDGHDRDRVRAPDPGRHHHRRVQQVRLQRRRRLDRLPPPLRDPPQRGVVELPRRRPRHPGVDRHRLRPAVVHPQRPLLSGNDLAERLPGTEPARVLLGAHHPQPQPGHRRQEPAQLRARPGEPGRSGVAQAGQPRLPAARDAAARHPDARRRPGRLAAAQRQRGHLVLDQHPVHRARRGTRRPVRRARLRPGPAVRVRRPGQLQRLLLQEPGLATALQPRRSRARWDAERDDDRSARLPERAAPPDRREPDLCLSGLRPRAAEGRPR